MTAIFSLAHRSRVARGESIPTFKPTAGDMPRSNEALSAGCGLTALSLMGVYLVITNLPGLVESLIQAALVESTFLVAGAHAVQDALGVSIGILLVVRAKRLSAVLAPD